MVPRGRRPTLGRRGRARARPRGGGSRRAGVPRCRGHRGGRGRGQGGRRPPAAAGVVAPPLAPPRPLPGRCRAAPAAPLARASGADGRSREGRSLRVVLRGWGPRGWRFHGARRCSGSGDPPRGGGGTGTGTGTGRPSPAEGGGGELRGRTAGWQRCSRPGEDGTLIRSPAPSRAVGLSQAFEVGLRLPQVRRYLPGLGLGGRRCHEARSEAGAGFGSAGCWASLPSSCCFRFCACLHFWAGFPFPGGGESAGWGHGRAVRRRADPPGRGLRAHPARRRLGHLSSRGLRRSVTSLVSSQPPNPGQGRP